MTKSQERLLLSRDVFFGHKMKIVHLKETCFSGYNRTFLAICEHVRTVAFCIISSTILSGCSTFNPQPFNERSFHKRIETQTEKDVRVSAKVLSAEEIETVFG